MKIALVGTGGTIAMAGRESYDWFDYAESKIVRNPQEVLDDLRPFLPDLDIEVVPFRTVGSTAITVADWCALRGLVETLAQRLDVRGIVVTHGTATLEETAWFLALTTATEKPIVLVGAQRPPNTIGSDAAPNLRAALLTANSEALRGCGVVVAMDGRIFDARSVTKNANHDLSAFEGRDGGPIGRITPDGIDLRHRPVALPEGRPWNVSAATSLPRVEISLSYAGNDGTAVRAFAAAGAKGIVSAGLPPGRPANQEREALKEAARSGIAVVLSSRASRGRVEPVSDARRDGFLIGSDLGPLKTRILLMLALTATTAPARLQEILDRF